MKLRVKGRRSLSQKILLLALLNVLLLAGMALMVARSQFQLGPESLLLGPARDRILAIANAFSLEYASTPAASRSELLAAYRRRYRADFYLTDPRGNPIAGPEVELSRALLDRMRSASPPLRPPLRERPPPPDGFAPPESRGEPPQSGPPLPRRELAPVAVFLAITRNPTNYWAGARIPISGPDDMRGIPGILLLRSDSLFSSNLFFDWRLWLGVAVTVVAVSLLCWVPFIRGLTTSIAQMDRVTEQIAQGRFDVQVSHGRRDELGHLGEQINRLASRLQGFVRNQKRFLGDIAHELCAPIARIQFALGILEQKAEEAQRPHVALLHEEIQEMSGLVNELLSFSRASLHAESVPLSAVDVAGLVNRTVVRDAPAGSSIVVGVDPGIAVAANEALLQRAVSNLLRNAIRYAGDSGPITIRAQHLGSETSITVADCGPGLPEGELEEVFAPFYRPESARTRETGGAGLGLAIVRTCVEACHGTVSCRNRTPSGLEVTIRLSTATPTPSAARSPSS